MGFTKVAGHFPDKIEDLDFKYLTNTHCFVLGDYMGIKNRIMQLPSVASRRELLKQKCLQDAMATARAQEGYETIVLGKTKDGAALAVAPDVERRTYEMIASLIRENEEDWKRLGKEGVDAMVTTVKKELTGFAKKVLADAAENYKPLGIVGLGKVKKVTGVLPPEFELMVK